jgi:hypothetical protein
MNAENSKLAFNRQAILPINPDLVWDYDIPEKAAQSDAFRRWYIARVLTRGRTTDLKEIGLQTIYYYFPDLNLPAEIYQFWSWYFSLPEVKQRYENSYALTNSNIANDRTNAT